MMYYSDKYKVLFKYPPPVSWCKFWGYMVVLGEYRYSRRVSEEEAKNLPAVFVYSRGGSYGKLLKALGGSMPKAGGAAV